MTSRSERLSAGLIRVPLACVLAALAVGADLLGAEEEEGTPAPTHPYSRIPTRNVFGVKPPPPPAPVEVAPEPPKERPEFFLTGFTRRGGDLRAFIAYQPKGKPMEFPDALLEGVEVGLKNGEDLIGTIKLVGLDESGDAVEIEFNGDRLTLDFEKNAMKAASVPASGGAPGAPGMNPNAPKGTLPPPPVPTFGSQLNQANPFSGGPTVVGRGGEVLGGFGNANAAVNTAVGLPAIQAGGSAIPGAITVPAIQAAPGQFGGLQTDTTTGTPPRRARVVEMPPFPSLPGNP
jgi:hypothetical protein